MPNWVAYIIGFAALLTAAGIIWTKFLRPTLRFYGTASEMVPLLRHLTTVFGDDPSALTVLEEIARQFKTDSGSSLKDQVNRLEAAIGRQEEAAKRVESDAEQLKVGVATQKALAEDDRRQLQALLVELGVNARAMAVLGESVNDIQKHARNVADDLREAHRRADEIIGQPHGAAADAASQQTAKEKRESD